MANQWLTGSGVPSTGIGQVTDYYRDTVSNLVYYRENAFTWVVVPAFTPSPDGIGTTWLHGATAPLTAQGSDGDYFYEDTHKIVYRKEGSTWVAKGSLDFIGIYGVQWGNGLGAPVSSVPLDALPAGSFYLDVVTSDIYYKGPSMSWELKGQLGNGGGGSGGGGGGGFVAITDITPTSISDNVGNKVKTDDNNVLQSCTSSTTAITVSVLAVTGSTFKPVVDINGTAATLTRNTLTDVWQGTAAITLTGASPYTVTATHSDGATDTATVTIEAAPVVSSMLFSNAYSQGAGQTEHAAGQTLTLTVTSATPFVELEVIGDSTTATTASDTTFASTTSKALSVTVANQGNIATSYPAKVRIRDLNGTWSNVFSSSDFGGTNGTHILALNNTRPSVTAGVITYPASQFALKGTEQATVNVTYSNADTALWSSTELIVSDPTVLGNKVVNRNDGVGSIGYNISTDNLQVVLTRTANATTATFSTVVWIADTNPVITKTLPAARLRSGVSAQNHVITLGSDQRLISIAMGAGTITGDAAGTFSGSWATANNGLTNTRTLVVADSDPKGTATFTGLSAINLAGKEVTTVTTNLDYVLGGFTQRTLTFPLWDANQIREVAIGTDVVDVTKLVAFNVTRNRATTYRATVGDEIDKFTIINGNTLYNCDLENASTALTSPVLITIEETVA